MISTADVSTVSTEATCTVALPETLADLLAEAGTASPTSPSMHIARSPELVTIEERRGGGGGGGGAVDQSTMSVASTGTYGRTEELETDLNALIHGCGFDDTNAPLISSLATACPPVTSGATVEGNDDDDDDKMVSSPLSEISSHESPTSFYRGGLHLHRRNGGKSTRFSSLPRSLGDESFVSVTDTYTGGLTIPLEGGLGEVMAAIEAENIHNLDHVPMSPLSVVAPAPVVASALDDSVEISMRAADVTEERTERLEGDLGALLASVATPNTRVTHSAAVSDDDVVGGVTSDEPSSPSMSVISEPDYTTTVRLSPIPEDASHELSRDRPLAIHDTDGNDVGRGNNEDGGVEGAAVEMPHEISSSEVDLSTASTEKIDSPIAPPTGASAALSTMYDRRMTLQPDVSYLELYPTESVSDLINGDDDDDQDGNMATAMDGSINYGPRTEDMNCSVNLGLNSQGGGAAASSSRVKPTPSKASADMMNRLRALNAEARVSNLQQCKTPLAIKNTVGIKRFSLMSSASRSATANKRSRVSEMALNIMVRSSSQSSCSSATANTAAATATATEVPSIAGDGDAVAAPSLAPIKPADLFRHVNLQKFPDDATVLDAENVIVTSLSSSLTSMLTSTSSSSFASSVSALLTDSTLQPSTRKYLDTVLTEILKAANEEVLGSVSKLSYDTLVDLPPSLIADQRAIQTLQVYSQRCKERSVESWSRWEEQLFTVASRTVEQRTLLLKKEMEQLATEKMEIKANALKLAKQREEERLKASSSVGDGGSGDQLRELQAQILSARSALEASREELFAVQEQVSTTLEDHKNRQVKLAEDTVGILNAAEEAKHRRKAERDAADERLSKELQSVKKEIHDLNQSIGVVNRMTYCRVLGYQSSGIKIEAALSPQLRATIDFRMSMTPSNSTTSATTSTSITTSDDTATAAAATEVSTATTSKTGTTGVLVVDGTDVELHVTDAHTPSLPLPFPLPLDSSHCSRETLLANAFFSLILGSSEISGPLSEKVLANVEEPRQIPDVMRKVRTAVRNQLL
jgi:hypothetical protein